MTTEHQKTTDFLNESAGVDADYGWWKLLQDKIDQSEDGLELFFAE